MLAHFRELPDQLLQTLSDRYALHGDGALSAGVAAEWCWDMDFHCSLLCLFDVRKSGRLRGCFGLRLRHGDRKAIQSFRFAPLRPSAERSPLLTKDGQKWGTRMRATGPTEGDKHIHQLVEIRQFRSADTIKECS